MGQEKVDVSNAAIYSKLLELEAMMTALAPLIPHIPAALALLDNPATRWKARRRADG